MQPYHAHRQISMSESWVAPWHRFNATGRRRLDDQRSFIRSANRLAPEVLALTSPSSVCFGVQSAVDWRLSATWLYSRFWPIPVNVTSGSGV